MILYHANIKLNRDLRRKFCAFLWLGKEIWEKEKTQMQWILLWQTVNDSHSLVTHTHTFVYVCSYVLPKYFPLTFVWNQSYILVLWVSFRFDLFCFFICFVVVWCGSVKEFSIEEHFHTQYSVSVSRVWNKMNDRDKMERE